MRVPTKKLRNGFEMPVYGLGLWQMGGRWESDTSKDGEEIKAILTAIDSGVLHIDTAEGYGDGHAEELLGEVLKSVDRSRLFISTKVSGGNQGYIGVRSAIEASLHRMGTKYVDLYLLHRYPEPGLSIEETMKAMNELVDEGKVKHIGVCNMSPKRFDEAQKHSKHKLVYNQLHYNVQYREVEQYDLLQHAVENDYFLAAWRPVQKGLLPKSSVLTELAEKYGKTETQIAINWLISQENVITLSKTSNFDHLEENLGALDWQTEKGDIERIREEFPDQKDRSDAVPLNYDADLEDK
jgi:diketogulonate reductase-like aldo/keto reductase